MVVVGQFKTNEDEEGGESSSCVSCWKEVDLEEMRIKPVKPVKPLKNHILVRFSGILLMR